MSHQNENTCELDLQTLPEDVVQKLGLLIQHCQHFGRVRGYPFSREEAFYVVLSTAIDRLFNDERIQAELADLWKMSDDAMSRDDDTQWDVN